MHSRRVTLPRAAACLLSAVALVCSTGANYAAADPEQPIVSIADIGGQPVRSGTVAQPLSGDVTANGSAGTGDQPMAKKLVADAGDTPFVATGDRAVLIGSAYGGNGLYTFAWSTEHGAITQTDSSSTELKTDGLEPGTYPVRLRVTDSAGTTATDTVLVVVHTVTRRTLLDQSREDGGPGTVVTGETVEFPFTVPAGQRNFSVDLSFTSATNDYDLEVRDPSGKVAGESGNAVGEPERVVVNGPVAGQWKAVATKWLTAAPNTMRVVVAGEGGTEDPRPRVDAAGPYAFATGSEQKLDGVVDGGTAPVTRGWDLDADGVFETSGDHIVANLPEGRHLLTLKATDAKGLERRQTTTVQVAHPDVIASQTTPVTVIGVADTGINPYHLEFSAQAYPDPDVLALTRQFTRHPSEYIAGYPAEAKPLEITHGQGYFPERDTAIWGDADTPSPVKANELYWIPGTKVIGAIDTSVSTGVTSSDDPHPILDDNGHGSGSASVSAGNRYGYCPTCLIVVVEGLDETVAAGLPWVDISTNSFGYVGGAPVGPVVNGSAVTKKAAERGQTTLFAAGNGVGNAFDVPVNTWTSDQTGPDWNVTVGAIRRDNQRAIVGDGIPVHLSSWGDGNLPSACRSGTVGQCAFGGTSAATPYTAGVFGTTLTNVRAAVGDGRAGQRPGQVVAEGIARDDSVFLADGKLTRDELRQAVLKNSAPLGQENATSPFPYPLTAPYAGDTNVLFEGYGAATPEAARRATDVLLGKAPMPERPAEDEFFGYDRAVRDFLWGGFDRDGDGQEDSAELSAEDAARAGLSLASQDGPEDALRVLGAVAEQRSGRDQAAAAEAAGGSEEDVTYYLHRRLASAPGITGCAATDNEQYMDRQNIDGDLEPCFESRVTSVAAAYRPLGIFAGTDALRSPLAAGSTVNVELYVAGETPSLVRPTGVLVATDREIGKGEGGFAPVFGTGPNGAACAAAGDTCWTKYQFSFETTRHAFTGEHLTFQVQLVGARSWAFGFESDHASKISIRPAPVPPAAEAFGATITSPEQGSTGWQSESVIAGGSYRFPELGEDPTGAGDHPAGRRVEVSLDDPSFAEPKEAVLHEDTGEWTLDLGELPVGEHAVYVRARIDGTTSPADSSTFTVTPDQQVQWQVVDRNGSADPGAWARASGVGKWTFGFDTARYGSGSKSVLVRLTERGAEVARSSARARFH